MQPRYGEMARRDGGRITGSLSTDKTEQSQECFGPHQHARPALFLLNNRERTYGYKLLVDPITQPAHNLLIIILSEVNKQDQLGEQLERDNAKFGPNYKRARTLDQQLATVIAE